MVAITPPDNERVYVTVSPESGDDLRAIEPARIIDAFRQHGAILFRGFGFESDSLNAFTRQFCSRFVINASSQRGLVSSDGSIQTVNLGNSPFPLHPELSRVPWRPDIAWFACVEPPLMAGETLLCDGIAIAEQLPDPIRDAVANRDLLYKENTAPELFTEWLGLPSPDETTLARLSEKSPFTFAWENGAIARSFVAPFLHQPLFSDRRAFANFILFARLGLKNPYFPTYEDGSIIPDEVVEEIAAVSARLTLAHRWQRGDILMVDNSRFMHGRNQVLDPARRVIWTQFGYASFLDADDPRHEEIWRHTDDPRSIFLGVPASPEASAASR